MSVSVTVNKGKTCRNEGGEASNLSGKVNSVHGKIYSFFQYICLSSGGQVRHSLRELDLSA